MNAPLLAFNRGLVSSSALARVDVERVQLSAEVQTNWFSRTQGSMMLRPGLQYLGSSKDDAAARWIEFVAATDDTALLEITDGAMRIWIEDEVIERGAVSTAISNGTFATSTGWTQTTSGGGDIDFGGSGLTLNAEARGGLAKVTREITVSAGDQGEEHALRIVVARGPVLFRCGSADGSDNYISETLLGAGEHSLAFTPISNFHLTFQTDLQRNIIVTSVAVESSGALEITAPWEEADLDMIRADQSADVVFVACEGYQQRRIERRAARSWSIVLYQPENGPFTVGRTSRVKLKPGATFGNTTLTADKAFFKSSHVGALFRLFHKGYNGSFKLGAEDQYTDPWRVSGVFKDDTNDISGGGYSDRNFSITVAGTWSGTLRIQRSFDDPDSGFIDYRESKSATTTDITGNGTLDNADSDDNAIIYYRVGFKPGEYTSGVAEISVAYNGGGDYGICRVTGFTSETQVSIEILRPFTGTDYTEDWREGEWSDRRGWPMEAVLQESRLWWFGRAYMYGSVSDDYANYSDDVEGDSGPIIRSIGRGPVDKVNFALPLQRLIIGTAGSEISVRSSSFDEPLTPTNTMAKDVSTQGSARVRAAKVDARGIFVQRSKRRVYELVFDAEAYDYRSSELTLLCPDIADGTSFADMAVQRQPDTRLHFILANGHVAPLTYEPSEKLTCWQKVTSPGASGQIEKAMVLPGEDEDQVYYHVRRTIDGSTKRYLEKFALVSECTGGTLNKQADSFVVYSGAPTTTVSAAHLEGEDLIVWADGNALEDADGELLTFTVESGVITLPASYSNIVAGLAYEADYKSTKLAYAAQLGTALTQPKRVNYLAVILANTHHRGLFYGPGFDALDPLPQVHEGEVVEAGRIYAAYDAPAFEFPGEYNTDSRICLRAKAPRPCEVLAAVVGLETHDKG